MRLGSNPPSTSCKLGNVGHGVPPSVSTITLKPAFITFGQRLVATVEGSASLESPPGRDVQEENTRRGSK